MIRLDLALVRRYPELSRRRARDVIEKGQVTLDGRTLLEPGLPVPAAAQPAWNPNRRARSRARLSLPRLYQDASLLVVDKPAGLLTVPTSPSATGEDTALARVREFAQHLTPQHPFVGAVHRLDRDTSGALAFALTPQARLGLRALFHDHRIERRYVALVIGHPMADAGVIDQPIRDAYQGGKRGVARAGEASLPALTRWRVSERFERAALLEIELETGRQHQIRIHLAHAGLPVLGDAVYGVERAGRGPAAVRRQMLHARLLAFTHPLTGESIRAEAPLPPDFEGVLAGLRARPSRRARA